MIERVDGAVQLIESKGQSAFAEMQQRVEPWYDDDGYVFVHDINGKVVVNSGFPQMMGREMRDFRDVAGKPVVQYMIDKAVSPGHCGWVHYLWPRPGEVEQAWKSTYVKLAVAPDKSRYVVATGYSDLPDQPCFAVQHVNDVVTLLEKEGEDAFMLLRSRVGPYIWKSSYVFVLGVDGKAHVYPAQPVLQGTNVSHLEDSNASEIFKSMNDVPYGEKGEWLEYHWPLPGEAISQLKRTFIRKARFGGKEYIVGCGIYVE